MLHAIRINAMLSVVIAFASCGEEKKEVDTNFDNYKPLSAAIEKAGKVTLYEGTPRERRDGKPVEGKVIKLHDFAFFEKQPVLKDEDAKSLTKLFCAKDSFGKWEGYKKCGGYHPDFCIEWKNGDDAYQVLVCLGCHEVKCFGPKAELYCDINSDAYKQFSEILTRYYAPNNKSKD